MRVFGTTDAELDRLERVAEKLGLVDFNDRAAFARVRRVSRHAEAALEAQRANESAEIWPETRALAEALSYCNFCRQAPCAGIGREYGTHER